MTEIESNAIDEAVSNPGLASSRVYVLVGSSLTKTKQYPDDIHLVCINAKKSVIIEELMQRPTFHGALTNVMTGPRIFIITIPSRF